MSGVKMAAKTNLATAPENRHIWVFSTRNPQQYWLCVCVHAPCKHQAHHTGSQSEYTARSACWWPAWVCSAHTRPWIPRCRRTTWWHHQTFWPGQEVPARVSVPHGRGRWSRAARRCVASPPLAHGAFSPVWPSACPCASSDHPEPSPARPPAHTPLITIKPPPTCSWVSVVTQLQILHTHRH